MIKTSILVPFFCIFISNTTANTAWSPSWITPERDDLTCRQSCHETCLYTDDCKILYESCCTCSSRSTWEGRELNLLIEYVSAIGKAVVLPPQEISSSEVYKIQHTHGELVELPSNLCNWDPDSSLQETINQLSLNGGNLFWNLTVLMDLRNNKIRSLPDINCLTQLDRLLLNNNEIEHLANTSLQNLTYLRYVDLSNNWINTMDPVMFSGSFHPFFFDMKNNHLTSIDASNIITDKIWCRIDYSSNLISEITNIACITLTEGTNYGPGFTDLGHNQFDGFPNFKEILNLGSLTDLGYLLACGFDLRGSPWNCDCNFFEFATLAKDIIEDLFLDYMDVSCDSPDKFKGMFVMNVSAEDLICSDIRDCPVACDCVDRPSKDMLFVNCSNRKLHEMPTFMPDSAVSRSIHLDVSNNFITKLPKLPYLNRTRFLNISFNSIQEISDSAIRELVNVSFLDMSFSNNLDLAITLPRSMQNLEHCDINITGLKVVCDCESRWISTWLERFEGKCPVNSSDNIFKCLFEDGSISDGRQFKSQNLQCHHPTSYLVLEVSIAAIALLLIAKAKLIYTFYYEIVILYIRFNRHIRKNRISPQFKYDVFISIDEENESVRKWVRNNLLPHLEDSGYYVFFPLRDLDVGVVRETAVNDILEECRNFLLIYSESYEFTDDGHWMENEWKYGWYMFKNNRCKNLVLVNFDHMVPGGAAHKQIKAYLRVGSAVSFLNRKGDIIREIIKRIGPPQNSYNKGHDNKKTGFCPNKLFQVIETKDVQFDLDSLGLKNCENGNKRFSKKNLEIHK